MEARVFDPRGPRRSNRRPHSEKESPLAMNGFSQRLHLAMDLIGMGKGRGRATKLADMFGVSRETARKWLNEMARPETKRMTEIAGRFGVSFEWLATGRGEPKGFMKVQDATAPYRVDNREQARLFGLISRLTRDQRRALLVILEQMARKD